VEQTEMDLNRSLVVDGNAVAGMLEELFSIEMTASPTECAACGYEGEVGTLLAFLAAPGLVLRCPNCDSVILRIVTTPRAVYLDARGAAFIRLAR
jgi:hypothetical protein